MGVEDKKQDCLFCRMVNKEIPSQLVHEDDHMVVFKDKSPQAPLHLLIVPRKHLSTLLDLQEQDEPLIGKMIRLSAQLAKQQGVAEDGFRTVFNCNKGAGQSVFHIHLHVLGGRSLTWPPG